MLVLFSGFALVGAQFISETDSCKQFKTESDCLKHIQTGYGGKCTWGLSPCDITIDHTEQKMQCATYCENQHTTCKDDELITHIDACEKDELCWVDIDGFVSTDDIKDKVKTVSQCLNHQVFDDTGSWKATAPYRDGKLACRGFQDGKRKQGGLCMDVQGDMDGMWGIDGFGMWRNGECDVSNLIELDYKMFGLGDGECAEASTGWYHTVQQYGECLDTSTKDEKKSYKILCDNETLMSAYTYTTEDCSGEATPAFRYTESGGVCVYMREAHNTDAFPQIGHSQPLLPDGCKRQQPTPTAVPTPFPTRITVDDCSKVEETYCNDYLQNDGQHCKWGFYACEETEKCGTHCDMMTGCSNGDVTTKVSDCITDDHCYLDLSEVANTDTDLTAYWQSRVYDQTGNSWAVFALADDGVATVTCPFMKDGLQKDGEMCMTAYGTQFGAGGFGYYNNDGFDPMNVDKKGYCEIKHVFALDLKYYDSSKCDGSVKQMRYVVNEDNCINTSDNEGNSSSMMIHCDTATTLTMTKYTGTTDCTGENSEVILDKTEGGIGSTCHAMDDSVGKFAQAHFGNVCSLYFTDQPTPAPTSVNPTPVPTTPTPTEASAAGVTIVFALMAAALGIAFQ
jgi:hypothetical protein